MNREKTVSYPDTGLLTYSYPDTLPYSVGKTRTMNSTESEVTTQVFDGLGRLRETQVNTDPNGADYVDITYDGLGRLQSKSNPYRPTAPAQTDGTTSYLYDPIGRLCLTVPPGGSTQSSCPTATVSGDVTAIYNDNCTTSFDESGHGRKTCTDGAGRLTGVWEDPAGLNYETDYKYDPLNDLTGVGQWGGPSGSTGERVRSFTYDALGRLLCASNPENSLNACPSAGGAIPSGVTSYTYDKAGNVLTKVDARCAAAG